MAQVFFGIGILVRNFLITCTGESKGFTTEIHEIKLIAKIEAET